MKYTAFILCCLLFAFVMLSGAEAFAAVPDSLYLGSIQGQATRNQKVGRGLQVGFVGCSDTLQVQGLFQLVTGAHNGYVLTSSATGIGTWQALGGGTANRGAYYNSSGFFTTDAQFQRNASAGNYTLVRSNSSGSLSSIELSGNLGGSAIYAQLDATNAANTAESYLTVQTNTDTSGSGNNIQLMSGNINRKHYLEINKIGVLVENAYTLPPTVGTSGYVITSDGAGGASWQPPGGGGAGAFWKTTGNSSTTPGTNFMGTTDDKDLVFKRWGKPLFKLNRETHAGNSLWETFIMDSIGNILFSTTSNNVNRQEILLNTNNGSIDINGEIKSITIGGDSVTIINSLFQLVDGTQGADKVLTSDANGLASWQPAAIVVASADSLALSAADANVTSYTPTATGTYRIGGYVNVTAVVTNIITLKVTYTDVNSNSVTQIIPLTLAATGVVGTTATVVGNNSATDIQIRAKIGSAITVLTTVTGVGSETYDVGATIEKLR